jgi:DNA-directed RNA polymerase subunit N (RpoN/RPB10)
MTEKGQKAASQIKSTTDKKERMLTLISRYCCRREGDDDGNVDE